MENNKVLVKCMSVVPFFLTLNFIPRKEKNIFLLLFRSSKMLTYLLFIFEFIEFFKLINVFMQKFDLKIEKNLLSGLSPTKLKMQSRLRIIFLLVLISVITVHGKIAFEKLTDYDFTGTTYYSVKNLSLYECQGWCNQEPECQAAAFSFVVNPLLPEQETLCQLQNDSQAMNPSAVAQRSNSMYYMVKLNIRSENICMRPWTFERVPNKVIRGLDNALIYTSTKEACLSACLNEVRIFGSSALIDKYILAYLKIKKLNKIVNQIFLFIEVVFYEEILVN